MFEIGRICYKTAGRDSNRVCVVVENIDEKFVMIDGDTRRKKVNIIHLEPTTKLVKIAKSAKTQDVITVLEKEGFKIQKKGDSKKTDPRPKKNKTHKNPTETTTVSKKPAKKHEAIEKAESKNSDKQSE